MTHFKTLARLIAPAVMALGVVATNASAQTTTPPLTLQVYNADAGSFHVNAVLVAGQTDAVLLDTGFTRADALRIAAMVLDSKKTLKTIFISQADPDYYFGIEVLKQYFPDAKVVTTAPTLKKIQATLATKLQVWGPRMGANAPKNVPLPEVLSGNVITLEGQALEVRGLDDSLPHRSYVWIPSLKAVAGGVNVYAGLHLWTADAQSVQERAEWCEEAWRDGCAATRHRDPRSQRAGSEAGRFADQLEPGLPGALRAGAAQGRQQRRAHRRDEEGLPGCRPGHCAGHRRQGEQGRDEVVSRLLPVRAHGGGMVAGAQQP